MGKHLRTFLFFAILVLFFLLLFCSLASALEITGNPGDTYVFPSESPVAADGTLQQSGPTISGNLVFWGEYDSTLNKSRLFFKDLSLGAGEPGHALITNEYHGGSPVLNRAATRVVWTETIGSHLQIYFKDAQAPGTFTTCTGTVAQCATPLAPSDDWQAFPNISPDGSKVVWENGRDLDSQIHIYDFSTGIEQELYGMPGGDQEYPSVDDEWVVWEDNRDYNAQNFPLEQHIYAKRIDSSDAPTSIADNGHSANASVGSAKISRNLNNEPVIVYVAIAKDLYGRSILSIQLYNLANGTDQTIASKAGQLKNPRMDGDKVVWLDCSENTSCDVVLHNLSSGVTQPVSQDPTLGATNPAVSNTSGYIVWRTTSQSPTNIYYNRMGDTAQVLAERFAPHLFLHHEEYFQPRKVDIFVNGEGTRLINRNNGDPQTLTQWPGLTLNTLGQLSGAKDQPGNIEEGKFIDLPGNVGLAWSLPSEWLFKHDFVNRYNEIAEEYPEQYYARVVGDSGMSRFAIQYWIPYYFNDFSDYHEGDWELIQVDLDENFEPKGAAFSQHTGATKRSWGNLDHSETHLISYVGRGSHANYFMPGEHRVHVEGWFDSTDYAEESEPIHEPMVEVLPDVTSANLGDLALGYFSWLAYQGAWGEVLGVPWLDAPQGPAATPEHQGTWDEPFTWYDTLPSEGAPHPSGEPYDNSYFSIASPADIHLYDKCGNHVGKNSAGEIEEQIPGAEYLEIPELHRKTIMVQGGDTSAGYSIILEGTGEGTFDFSIGAPSRSNNFSDTVDYVNVPVSIATRVELEVNPDTGYALKIDNNGDGLVDEQRLPDDVTRYNIDLTAPSPVTDLAVADIFSGAAKLTFTAPGDDANAGTAQYYDIRYSKTPITEDTWKDAEPTESISSPQLAGSIEAITIGGLESGTSYYFALKTKDDEMRKSTISNLAQGTTNVPVLTWSMLRVFWANWQDYENRYLSVEYQMHNIGSGVAIDSTVQASISDPSTVNTVTPLPLSMGDLPQSSSANVTLKYYVPTTVYNFTSTTYTNCKDDEGRLYWFPESLS